MSRPNQPKIQTTSTHTAKISEEFARFETLAKTIIAVPKSKVQKTEYATAKRRKSQESD